MNKTLSRFWFSAVLFVALATNAFCISQNCRLIVAKLPAELHAEKGSELYLQTTGHTYIPGAENTENPYSFLLLKAAAPFLKDGQRVLVLGAGSGYESIAIAEKFESISVTASDVDDGALRDLQMNVSDHEVGARVQVLKSNLFSELGDRQFDVIIFAAPRPLHMEAFRRYGPLDSVRMISALSKRHSHFDSWGTIHERVLAEFSGHLAAGGHFVLLSDATFPHENYMPRNSGLQKRVLAAGDWSAGDARDGQFQIVDFSKPY